MVAKRSNGWIKFCNSKYRMKNKLDSNYSLSDAMAEFKSQWHSMSKQEKAKWNS